MSGELELKSSELPDPWDRRPGETAKPYRAFTAYLALDLDERSITRVAQKLSVSRALISRWSSQYCWSERASAYDEFASKRRLERMQAAREQLADETLKASRQALQLVLRSLGKLKSQKVGAANAARLLAVAVQAWKAVFGDDQSLSDQIGAREIPVLRVETNVSRYGYDYSKLLADLLLESTRKPQGNA